MKPNEWSKETWLAIFVGIIIIYFMTLNSFPDNLTGAFSVEQDNSCEWDFLTDIFDTDDVLSLDLNEIYRNNLNFFVESNDGKIYLKDNLLVFFPEKKENLIKIISKNNKNSCSKTIKVYASL